MGVTIRDSNAFSSTFARGLSVIEAFGLTNPRMSLSEIAGKTELDRAVARRLIITLVELGYAKKTGRTFELTPQILSLGHSFLSSHGFGTLMTRDLDRLSIEIAETVSVSVWSGKNVTTIARSNAAGRHVVTDSLGTSLPIHASAAGRVLISALPQHEIMRLLEDADLNRFTSNTLTSPSEVLESIEIYRRSGWLISNEELEIGLISAAIPLRDAMGNVLASLNVSSQTSRMTKRRLEQEVIPKMVAASSSLMAHIV